jgi:ketosteroid isomerase-like protein
VATIGHGEGQDLLERYKSARERRDVESAIALFAEEAEYRPGPFEEPLRGRNAIREWWNARAAAEVNVEFDAERVWVAGDTVLASFHGAHTLRRSAERVRSRGFLTFELDGRGAVTRLKEWTHSRVVGRDSTVRPEAAEAEEGPFGG